MDFDLHFGRFFGLTIDVFEKFLLPDFELQLEIRSAKIVILGKMQFFTKLTFLLWSGHWWKTCKKLRKITSKSNCFFTLIFLGFGSQLGWILASKLDPKKLIPTAFFPSCGQEASKRRPRGSKSVPRASQEPPTASQEGPKSAQERSKRAQGTPKVPPKGHFVEDFLVFQCFSTFFCVFLRFSVFFCVFSVFFYSVPPLTFSPCRAS